tara:strand:+ start:55 stop:1530 length:1476 start_codon:yes stop_codon:yes gene_type:complete
MNKFSINIIFSLFILYINPVFSHELPEISELAENALPSVVSIKSEKKIDKELQENNRGVIPRFFRDFEEFYGYRRRPEPQFRPRQEPKERIWGGSGFVISKDGYIVTNHHVVDEATNIEVIFDNKNDETYVAEVVGVDDRMDLALLKIDADKALPYITFGDSKESKVGEWVVAIGNPFSFGGSVSLGIISGLGRDIKSGPYDSFIQTDASINRGNSGGPLLNLDGEVIGVNTAIWSRSGENNGIGFAIPSELAKSVINQLKEFGETRRGRLGVVIAEVTDEVAKDLDLDLSKGALVQNLAKDGPAEKAGIQIGDVIIKFDNVDINKTRDLTISAANAEIGKNVNVEVIRLGKKKKFKVKIDRFEGNEDSYVDNVTDDSSSKILGMTFGELNSEIRSKFSLPQNLFGVAVASVDEKSEAFLKNIEVGSVITNVIYESIDGPMRLTRSIAVNNPEEAYNILNERKKAGDERILVRVWRPKNRVLTIVALSFKK